MNKNSRKNTERNIDMYRAILTLNTVDECMRFFDDLCSVTELRAMEQRFQVAVLLNQGNIYNDILEQTGASSATIKMCIRDSHGLIWRRRCAGRGYLFTALKAATASPDLTL